MLTEQDITQIASLIASNNQQLSAMMDNKFQAQKQDILNQMQEQKQDILTQMVSAMQEQTEALVKMNSDSETRISIKIENDVCKRIDSLFDGYKLTHEKQYELERKMERLESELDSIRNILAVAGLAG